MGSRGMRFGLFILLLSCIPHVRSQDFIPNSSKPVLIHRSPPKQSLLSVREPKLIGAPEQAGPQHWSDIL